MFSSLKAAMREAGINVSAGGEVLHTEMQAVRDFLYFRGHNLGEEFHKFKDVLEGSPAPTAQLPTQIAATVVETIAPVIAPVVPEEVLAPEPTPAPEQTAPAIAENAASEETPSNNTTTQE